LVKVAALVVLAGFGWEHRRRTVPRLAGGGASARRAFVRLAAAELLLMAGTYGVAVALSRAPLPT
ncbi:MAG: hypothetical protein GEV11_17055, partial [Streptosporangiales bacterium]|nr:hypothetical protein [Streptosporangiales bacterium]